MKKFIRKEDELDEILYISNLPSSISEGALEAMLQNHVGFVEVRIVPGKSDVAFAEFSTSLQAAAARVVLNGFQIVEGSAIVVNFAKR